MNHLLQHMDKVFEGVASNGQVLLALDFDGTLAEIVPDPADATLPESIFKLLEALNNQPRFTVAVVSGRSLVDLKERVKLPDVAYAGDHGLEISGPGFHHIPPEAEEFRTTVAEIGEALEAALKGIPGVIFEHKGLSMSIHYRLTPSGQRAAALRTIRRVTKPYLDRDAVRVVKGKEVVNLLPPLDWHKGAALKWLINFLDTMPRRVGGILPIYIGDDVTDEDAFKAVRESGFAVRVGRPKPTSAAPYYVKSTTEVEEVLQALLDNSKSLDIPAH
ncbi:MAG: trehalose-phosphatase [Chloroflexi bacterium]|nr:trehalose-phosphatase [Chloroflexota bacterium]